MNISGYHYSNAEASHTHAYLWEPVFREMSSSFPQASSRKVFDLGCGSGAFAAALKRKGFDVCGVDPSATGIASARKAFQELRLEVGSTEENLASRFGRFDAVISLEVVEHVFAPREFASRTFDLLIPGGVAIISTPYHGYLKNLMLAVTGKLDEHFTALWDYGHIKFWSIRTLGRLLTEAGFENITFLRVGRIPQFAKSMIAIAHKPQHP